ncbi:MAG TPA: DNA primase [Bacillota bacterium]|nr:DNA primase [Bacillota bacterium]HOK68892.1 DNA primase [Bacillota bacterium]HPP84697.1 DNA primase [Bacillota bacterium]
MAFSQRFLEEIRERNDIEEVIGQYVPLKRAGSNLVGLCPFHNERTPSFTVFPGTRSFYCFGCCTGGDVFTFVMRSQNLDYPEAVEFLAKRAGIPIEEDEFRKSEKPLVKKERIIEVTTEAARFFRDMLLSPQGEAARRYLLENRRLTSATIKHFGIGYAPDSWDALTRHLTEKGFTPLELTTAFLSGTGKSGKLFDIFRNRIMFPIFDAQGEVVAFSGRRLNEADERKYVNTSDTPAFNKRKLLFGLHIAKNTKDATLILCEGAVDAIALHQAGFSNAVATLGTALTSDHARLIAKYAKTVFLAYDVDSAGKTATMKGIALLNQVGVDTKIISWGSDAKDPDEYIKKHGADAFRNKLIGAIGQVDYKINEILAKYNNSVPDEKIRALGELTDFISDFWNRSEREIYAARAAELLSLTKAAVLEDVERKAKIKERRQKKAFAEKSIQASEGFGDRVNPNKLRFSAEAKLEEAILGIMLLCTDLAPKAMAELDEDCFVTEFNRRVFNLFKEEFSEAKEAVLSKNGILSQDEISAVARYIASRRRLNENSEEVLLSYIHTLKEQKKKRDYEKKIEENPLEGLTEYINLKKKG